MRVLCLLVVVTLILFQAAPGGDQVNGIPSIPCWSPLATAEEQLPLSVIP
uniref:Antimicrobial-peptide n=1 Tax=Alligator sinensis TaxID=38654 RepID=A0A2H4ZLD7_ALLSI|nr:antimicrobial-peptide [Alligator sinensis]